MHGDRMPLFRRGRPLKRWRYVGVYGPELMLCVGRAQVGPARQSFWALAERGRPLRERTSLRSAGVRLDGSRALVASGEVRIDVSVQEDSAAEGRTYPNGAHGYVWTRKQAGVPARGTVEVDGRRVEVDARAIIDDTVGYHERHSSWRWSAGVGRVDGGGAVAWNLVSGINDAPGASERRVWVSGEAAEVGPVGFAEDLSSISFAGGERLEFKEWSARANRTNLLLVRSHYRQPFGTFSGELPGGLRLSEGYGVMEEHEVWW